MPARLRVVPALLATAMLGLGASSLVPPATATPAGDAVVVNEVYGGGGNSGATYKNDFIELYNPTGSPVDLSGYSVQYFSAAGSSGGSTSLSGSIPAHGYYLVQEAAGAGGTTELPTPDTSGSLNMSGTSGSVALLNSGTTLDLVGYGTATKNEAAAAPALTNTTSASRTDGKDTDNNSADFRTGSPTPQNSSTAGSGGGQTGTGPVTIEQVQGSGDVSPLAGQTVTTDGVVTAVYAKGGFNGFYMQTADTGGALDMGTHDTSDAVFVYGSSLAGQVSKGQHVQVTGTVTEYNGLTEINGSNLTQLAPAAQPRPASVAYPRTDVQRESLEGMLVAPQGEFTVADTYSLNSYGSIGLATGDRPLWQPTEVADPHDAAAVQAVKDENAARAVTLDDGSSSNYVTNAVAKNTPLSYLTQDQEIRVGEHPTFTEPVILDYRNRTWDFQPTYPVDGTTSVPVTFSHDRPAQPTASPGNVHVASFNVLNYFPTTGEDWVAAGGSCTWYDDRAGEHVTVNTCTRPDGAPGPRGAADQGDFERQQAKIVAAINHMGADVVSLEEIENAARFGHDRDWAVAKLVDALNADAGAGTWKYVPTPSAAGDQDDEDVIRTAFIYKPAAVRPVGESQIDDAPAFDNARDPLAQVFRAADGGAASKFAVIVNHFKSKGSGVDDGTGQGNANPDRVAQARELVAFADRVKGEGGTDRVFLSGDFNSYTREDPMQVLREAGYTDVGHHENPDEFTYLFGGMVGSLDHVLATPAALQTVAGAHVWNINSVESVAHEYSRYNYNATDFYQPTPFRASDHDPLVVGMSVDKTKDQPAISLSTQPDPVVRKQSWTATVTVRADGVPAEGHVTVSENGRTLATGSLQDGSASLAMPAYTAGDAGSHRLTIAYSGSDSTQAGETTATIQVVKK